MYLSKSATEIRLSGATIQILSILLGIATPIKYFLNDPQYVKLLGMPHGILFMLYVAMAFVLKKEFEWDNKSFGFVLLASIIPFGTFYIDRRYLKIN